MKIFVDGDSSPVMDMVMVIGKVYGLAVAIVHADAIQIKRDGVEIICCKIGADSADHHILARLKAGDVVVTNDTGLASLALIKGARAINNFGTVYQPGLFHHKFANSHISIPTFAPRRNLEDDLAFIRKFLHFLNITPLHHPQELTVFLDYTPKRYLKIAVTFCEIFQLGLRAYTSKDPYFASSQGFVDDLMGPAERQDQILKLIKPGDLVVAQRTELEFAALDQGAKVIFLNGLMPDLAGYITLSDGTVIPHPLKQGKDESHFADAFCQLLNPKKFVNSV